MNILDEIVAHKKEEVEVRMRSVPVKKLEQRGYFSSPVFSLREYLLRSDKSGIIAEIKRKSPSQGIINPDVSIERISTGYVQAGASALSILTDHRFFGGSDEDLSIARKMNACPILRKDFIIGEYQVVEAKSIGADAILLIAAVLSTPEIKKLTGLAHSIGLEVLMEVHNEEELTANLSIPVDLIGVNNRNLKTFQVSLETSRQLGPLIPKGVVKVAESGIESPAAVLELKGFGFDGFLMGQTFMQTKQPGGAAREFIMELKKLEKR